MGLNFAFYESINSLIDNWKQRTEETYSLLSGLLTKAAVGGISGGMSKLIVYPLVSYLIYSLLSNSKGLLINNIF